MKKIAIAGFLLMFFSVSFCFAQEQKIEGRYIEIDDYNNFFVENEANIETPEFYIKNFDEKLSSKPIQVGVNELNNVVKFGIASGSEKFYGQRRCFIIMEKSNYKETFYNALKVMGVESVIINGDVMSIGDFLNFIKS
jgi:hypothetical protein